MNLLFAFLCSAFFMGPTSGSVYMPGATTPPQWLPDSPLICSPNPVHDQLTIRFDNNTDHDLVWEVYDLTGRMIENGVYPADAQALQIEAGAFHSGLLLLSIGTPDGNDRKTVRFIKE